MGAMPSCPRCNLKVTGKGHVTIEDCFAALLRQYRFLKDKAEKQARYISKTEHRLRRKIENMEIQVRVAVDARKRAEKNAGRARFALDDMDEKRSRWWREASERLLKIKELERTMDRERREAAAEIGRLKGKILKAVA